MFSSASDALWMRIHLQVVRNLLEHSVGALLLQIARLHSFLLRTPTHPDHVNRTARPQSQGQKWEKSEKVKEEMSVLSVGSRALTSNVSRTTHSYSRSRLARRHNASTSGSTSASCATKPPFYDQTPVFSTSEQTPV